MLTLTAFNEAEAQGLGRLGYEAQLVVAVLNLQ